MITLVTMIRIVLSVTAIAVLATTTEQQGIIISYIYLFFGYKYWVQYIIFILDMPRQQNVYYTTFYPTQVLAGELVRQKNCVIHDI